METPAEAVSPKDSPPPAESAPSLRLSLASPLGLKSLLRTSRPRFGALPWINVGVIAVMFSFHMGLFVYGGLGMSLPVRSPGLAQGASTTAVLTVRATGVYFFNGALSNSEDLPNRLRSYLSERREAHPVLLIKADKYLPLEELFRICEMARTAGFESAQIGGENKAEAFPQSL